MEKLDIYTGTLIYKNIEFSFVFDGEELRLIPPHDKRDEVHKTIIMEPIGDGVYTMASPKMEEEFLTGKCNENGKDLIFITKKGSNIGSYNDILIVNVAGYILCKYDNAPICKMTFHCPELDCIYPVSQGFKIAEEENEFEERGIVKIITNDFERTSTEWKSFRVNGKEIQVRFGISRTVGWKVGQPPLVLQSNMIFKFEPTNDYAFIVKLWLIAKEFIQFLCYRKDVYFPEVFLSKPSERDKKTIRFATLNMWEELREGNIKSLKRGRFIKLSYLSGMEGLILNDIAENRLYTRHIPDSYESGCHIDAARFVMITSAFEWEFKRLYPDGITKSKKTLAIEATVAEEIQKLVDNSTKDIKKKYKFLLGRVDSQSLQEKIMYAGKDLNDIIDVFGKQLYSLNDVELIYSEMSKRLSDQRNHFSHGDLDIDFIDDSLLDVVYTERIVYAMQLKYYGIEDRLIQKAINKLFGCNLVFA